MLTLLAAWLPLTGVPLDGSSFELASPTHPMSTTFDRGGIRVHGPAWGVQLELKEWGRAEAPLAVSAVEPKRDGQRVEYDHGDLTEWYVNTPRGLEQGFTIESRPDGTGPLRIVLSVGAEFTPEVLPGGRDARFTGEDQDTVLHYVGLEVFGADGDALDARLVAEGQRLAIEVDDEGAAFPLLVDPWMGTELAMLLSGHPTRESVGSSLAFSGDTFVTGAPREGFNEGAAYVWERDLGEPSGWREVVRLQPSDPENYSTFGSFVDIDGDLIAVSQPADGSWASDYGNVYLFERDQGGPDAWGEIARISNPFSNSDFGHGLSISGDSVVIGAPSEGVGFGYLGAAYLYGRDIGGPGAWGLERRFDSPNPGNADWYGYGLALSGDLLFVGSAGDSVLQYNAGAVYVYDRNQGGAGAWGQIQQLRPSDIEAYMHFGFDLAYDGGDVLLVGAESDDHSGIQDAGSAYVFEYNGSSWNEVQKLTAATPQDAEHFGIVSMSGDTAVVGSYYHEVPGTQAAGGAYLFRRSGSGASWTQEQVLHASNPQDYAKFGQAVAIEGYTALVGASGLSLGNLVGTMRSLATDPNTGTLYGVDSFDQLVVLDPVTSIGTPIGDTGIGGVDALAFDPAAGLLYAIHVSSDTLYAIDPVTANSAPIGTVSFKAVQSLAFDPGLGLLYGCDKASSKLVTIDPVTAIATEVGPTGDFITGLAFDATTGTLYGSDPLTDELVTIDTQTGAMTTVGKLGFINVHGLAYDPLASAMFGSDINTNQLIGVDTTTGAGTAIGWPGQTYEGGIGAVYVIDVEHESETYCTAGVSASGCRALISSTGTPSASAPSGFVLEATGVEGSKSGHFYFGFNGRKATPWGSGTSYQCVVPPVKRGGPQTIVGTTGACDGYFSEDLSARWTSHPAQNPGPGVMGQAQLWYRDPQNTSNQTTSLSDAIEFFVKP